MSSILLALLPIIFGEGLGLGPLPRRGAGFLVLGRGLLVPVLALLGQHTPFSCLFQAISTRKQGLSAGAGEAAAASQCYKYLRRPQPGPGMNCKNEDRWSSRTAEKWKARAPVTAEDTRKDWKDQEKNREVVDGRQTPKSCLRNA